MNQIESQLFEKTIKKLPQKEQEECIAARVFQLTLGIYNWGQIPKSYQITALDYIKAYCLVHGLFLATFPDGKIGFCLKENANEFCQGIQNDRLITIMIVNHE